MTRQGYMFFIGDTPMNCVDGWRLFRDKEAANRYLSPHDVAMSNACGAVDCVFLRRVRVTVEVVNERQA